MAHLFGVDWWRSRIEGTADEKHRCGGGEWRAEGVAQITVGPGSASRSQIGICNVAQDRLRRLTTDELETRGRRARGAVHGKRHDALFITKARERRTLGEGGVVAVEDRDQALQRTL